MKRIFYLMLINMTILSIAKGQEKQEAILVDGIKRSFLTYIPAAAKQNERMPLIISLHGGLATPKGQFRLADFRPIADTGKFIVVCPASKHIWHEGKNIHGIDDVKFISQLITYMVNTYHADPQRVYIAGISNGGFMASRLACQLSDRIAAVAVVAATMNQNEGYAPVKPLPVMYMHGTSDPVFNNDGGKAFGRKFYSQAAVIQVWADLAKCTKPPLTSTLPDTAHDGTNIIKQEYVNPATGIKVVGFIIVNGGHTWPGGWQYLPRFIVGKTTKNLNACQEMWHFFKMYRLN